MVMGRPFYRKKRVSNRMLVDLESKKEVGGRMVPSWEMNIFKRKKLPAIGIIAQIGRSR